MLLLLACGKEPPAAGEARTEAAVPSPAAAPEAAPQAIAPDATPADRSPGVRPDGEIVSAVEWFHGSFEQALARAKAEHKLVFVDIGAYWCPPCHRLDEEVFVRPEVGRYLSERVIALHVDAEKGEGPELAERYRVQAYPTMLVLEPTGVEKARIVDFVPAEALLETLERISTGGNVLAALIEAVENDPDDLHRRYELAHAHLLAADAEAARPQIEAVLLGDPKGELGLATRALYDRALFSTYKLEGDPEAALEEFRALQRRFPDSKEAVRAYRHIGRLLHALGRDDEAVASLQAMLATRPDDPTLASSFGWFAFRQRCGVREALVAVQAARAKTTDDADLHYLEAELLHLLGDDAPALAAIRRASALEPKTAFYRRQVRRFEGLVEATP